MPGPRRRGLLTDAALSLCVYLLPIVSPHMLFFAWMLLARPIARAGTEAPGWTAANWIVLLSAQVVLFTVLRLSRPLGRIARGGLAVATLAVLTVAVNWLLMVVVPLRYLTEDNTAAEVNTLTDVCRVDGVSLQAPSSGAFADGAPAVLVRRTPSYTFARLRLPGCELVSVEHVPADADVAWVSPGGSLLWRTRDDARAERHSWTLTSASGTTWVVPLPLEQARVSPVILADEQTVAWVDWRDRTQLVTVWREGGRMVDISGLPRGSTRLHHGGGPAGPFLLSVNAAEESWFVVDGEGRVLRSISAPDHLSRFANQLHPLGRGWIGWDTYREQGPSIISWGEEASASTHTLPRGLGIQSAALDPGRAFVAASATSGLSIGRQRDEVFLIRLADGAELFRRYAPKYSRAVVALPSGGYFVVDDGAAAVRVLRLPE